MAITVRSSPLSSQKVILPVEQNLPVENIAQELPPPPTQEDIPLPSSNTPSAAEQEYFGGAATAVPPLDYVPAQQTNQQVDMLQEQPRTMPNQEMLQQQYNQQIEDEPLQGLRNNYIENYKQLYNTDPSFKGDELQDAAYLTDENQKLENLINIRDGFKTQEDEHSKYVLALGQNYKDKAEFRKSQNNKNLTDAKIAPLFWVRDSLANYAFNEANLQVTDNVTGEVLSKDNSMMNAAITAFGGNQQDKNDQTIVLNTLTMALAKWLGTDRATEYEGPDENASLEEQGMGSRRLVLKDKKVRPDQEHSPEDDKAQLMGILNDTLKGANAAEAIRNGAEPLKATGMDIVTNMLYQTSLAMRLKEEVDVNGQKKSRRTPEGNRIAYALRYFFDQYNPNSLGRTKSEPTKYGTKGYNTSLDLIRPGDFRRPDEDGVVKIANQFLEAAEISGNQGTKVDEHVLAAYQILSKDANKTAIDNEQILSQYENADEDTKENVRRDLRNNQRGKGGTGLFKTAGLNVQSNEYQIASKGVMDSFSYLEGNLNNLLNKIRYHMFRTDPSTGRIYDDVVDFNLQRDKIARNAAYSNASPLKVSQGNFTGFSKEEIYNNQGTGWWNRIKKRLGKKAPVGSVYAEMDFLLTVAMSMDPDTNGKTPWQILFELTPEKIQTYSEIGSEIVNGTSVLKDLLYQNKGAILSNPNITLEAMPQGYKTAIDRLMNEFKGSREDLGFKIRAAVDAFNYVNAKKTGTAFIPRSTFAIDMNSAGRSMMAADVGNTDFLKSVGAIFDYQKDLWGHYVDPENEPRTAFIRNCLGVIPNIFNDPSDNKADKIKNLFLEFMYDDKGKPNRSFISSFAKKVLLTTDYGKPSRYHTDEAEQFFYDNPDFANEWFNIMDYKPGTYSQLMFDAVVDMNQIYWKTLEEQAQGTQFQVKGPKNMGKLLSMAGLAPKFEGFYKEKIPFGSYINIPSGKSMTFTDSLGNNETVQLFSRKYSAIASAPLKIIGKPDWENRKWITEHFDPGPSSKIVNMIGPFLGQYRESLVVAETITGLNKGKKAEDLLFMSPVFDNLICDSASLAQTIYYANNIALPKVMSWNVQSVVRNAYIKQLSRVDKFIKDMQAKGDQEFLIDKYSDYSTSLYHIDQAVKQINEEEDAGAKYKETKSKNKKEKENNFLNDLKRRVPKYSYKKDRFSQQESYLLSATDIGNLVSIYIKYKGVSTDLKDWEGSLELNKPTMLKQLLDSARKGTIVFMM